MNMLLMLKRFYHYVLRNNDRSQRENNDYPYLDNDT